MIGLINYRCRSDSRIDHNALEIYAEKRAGFRRDDKSLCEKLGEHPIEIVKEHLKECKSCRDYFKQVLDVGECPLKY